ncbi:MAG: cren protein [Pyrodictiaceae archaeon]
MGDLEKLIPVRVASVADLARIAANIVALGQVTYIMRFRDDGKIILGLIAVLRDYYNLYGLPLIYYYVDEKNEHAKGNYMLVRVDDRGEHIEFSETTKPGWIAVPIVNLASKPTFMPKLL